jgi:hypothetical protein
MRKGSSAHRNDSDGEEEAVACSTSESDNQKKTKKRILKVKTGPQLIQKKKGKKIPPFSDTSSPDNNNNDEDMDSSFYDPTTEDQDDEESAAPEKNDGKSHHHHHKRERVKTTCTVSARMKQVVDQMIACTQEQYNVSIQQTTIFSFKSLQSEIVSCFLEDMRRENGALMQNKDALLKLVDEAYQQNQNLIMFHHYHPANAAGL